MPADLAERLWKRIALISASGEALGSVTVVVEKGWVAKIVLSVDELLKGPGPQPHKT